MQPLDFRHVGASTAETGGDRGGGRGQLSRLIGADEEGTLSALRAHRHQLIDPLLAAEREKAKYKDLAHLEYYLEGLRKAGMPE